MDPLSAVGLWTISLVGIGGLVYAARVEAKHHRRIDADDEHVANGGR